MKEREICSWEQFEEQLRLLREDRAARRKATAVELSDFLFRGQSDSGWSLSTTLERQRKGEFSFRQYYRLISVARPQIETLTATAWNVIEYPDYEKWLEENDTMMPGRFPGYDYMVYLRHHGFPSPLLDWTRSAYVAAYFAFAHALAPDGKVSIYVYWERARGVKAHSVRDPHIHVLGPYVRTHRRHFLQQSEYTICMVRENEWMYASHESALSREDDSQDLLWKFNIPSSERAKVLKHLDEHNVNAFSLFSSEESLMETLTFRELHFRERGL